MLTRLVTGTLLLIVLAFSFAESVSADDDAEKRNKLTEQFATPGPQHEQLKRLAGAWNIEIKSWFPDPAAPSKSKGRAKFTVLLDGRYVRQDFRSEMEGQKFRGMGILGYDNAQKKYVGVWIDNHGTGIMHSHGTYDAKTHTLTELATSSSPLGDMKFKMVTHYKKNDEFVFTMYESKPDGDNKLMEMTYSRVADDKKTAL